MPNTDTGDNDLWQPVYAAFPYPSESVQGEINRIAVKCLKKAGLTGPVAFDPSTCDVHAEVIGGKELVELIRYHERTNVTDRTGPIVIVRVGGSNVVIEGNNRVNKWVSEGD